MELFLILLLIRGTISVIIPVRIQIRQNFVLVHNETYIDCPLMIKRSIDCTRERRCIGFTNTEMLKTVEGLSSVEFSFLYVTDDIYDLWKSIIEKRRSTSLFLTERKFNYRSNFINLFVVGKFLRPTDTEMYMNVEDFSTFHGENNFFYGKSVIRKAINTKATMGCLSVAVQLKFISEAFPTYYCYVEIQRDGEIMCSARYSDPNALFLSEIQPSLLYVTICAFLDCKVFMRDQATLNENSAYQSVVTVVCQRWPPTLDRFAM
ncbi:hypothetical protein SNEBB_000911 [Seison nebaliae]|nr:hypothetical protein SNEBB_000911 [Seison nebaliae]